MKCYKLKCVHECMYEEIWYTAELFLTKKVTVGWLEHERLASTRLTYMTAARWSSHCHWRPILISTRNSMMPALAF